MIKMRMDYNFAFIRPIFHNFTIEGSDHILILIVFTDRINFNISLFN